MAEVDRSQTTDSSDGTRLRLGSILACIQVDLACGGVGPDPSC
jgi:hypothetical protein